MVQHVDTPQSPVPLPIHSFLHRNKIEDQANHSQFRCPLDVIIILIWRRTKLQRMQPLPAKKAERIKVLTIQRQSQIHIQVHPQTEMLLRNEESKAVLVQQLNHQRLVL